MTPECLVPYFDSCYLAESHEDYEPEVATPPDFVPRPLSPNTFGDFEDIQRLPEWMVVMRVVVVHAEFKTAAMTGLLRLLGDAPVRIVDMGDEDKIEALFCLAETCQSQTAVSIGQDFSRESPDSIRTWERRLKRVLKSHFRLEKITAIVRPAIMFRLCTDMCNHITAPNSGINSPQESVPVWKDCHGSTLATTSGFMALVAYGRLP